MEEAMHYPSMAWINGSSHAKLFRRRSANDLPAPIGTDPFREGRANLIGDRRKILLGSAQGFPGRQANLSAAKQSSGGAIFTGLGKRNLP
jgi:hypothetical protein